MLEGRGILFCCILLCSAAAVELSTAAAAGALPYPYLCLALRSSSAKPFLVILLFEYLKFFPISLFSSMSLTKKTAESFSFPSYYSVPLCFFNDDRSLEERKLPPSLILAVGGKFKIKTYCLPSCKAALNFPLVFFVCVRLFTSSLLLFTFFFSLPFLSSLS